MIRALALGAASALWLAGLAAPCRAQTLVLVADGAGDFRCCSTMLRRAAMSAGAPVRIETFVWSHGYRRSIADQVDAAYARAQGDRLAAEVRRRLAENPQRRICLAGHSAGCAVVLTAAERLPPDSLGCMVLLAPSVPAAYDLSGALPACRGGIHVFCSCADHWMMAAVRWLEILKSGRPLIPAGRAGFQAPPCADDVYARLRTYPWNPCLARFGHDGGHFGGYQPAYVRGFILPLFITGD